MRTEQGRSAIENASSTKTSLHAVCDMCKKNIVLLLHTQIPDGVVPVFSGDVAKQIGKYCASCKKLYCRSCAPETGIQIGTCPVCKHDTSIASNMDMLNTDTVICEFAVVVDAAAVSQASEAKATSSPKQAQSNPRNQHLDTVANKMAGDIFTKMKAHNRNIALQFLREERARMLSDNVPSDAVAQRLSSIVRNAKENCKTFSEDPETLSSIELIGSREISLKVHLSSDDVEWVIANIPQLKNTPAGCIMLLLPLVGCAGAIYCLLT